MPDNYSIFDTYHTFDSIFDIYPDKIHIGAVVGYRKQDGTLLEFPCMLDISKAVKDNQGRWTASGRGLRPVVAKVPDSPLFNGVKEAWIGNNFREKYYVYVGLYKDRDIERVRFLDNVLSIGAAAFLDCRKLKESTIPETVTSIEKQAFQGCTSLKKVKVPSGVTKIEASAFSDCVGLISITLPEKMNQIGKDAFAGCKSLTDIKIPDGITAIESYTFAYCKQLTHVTIPDTVTTIGEYAFECCHSLTSIIIPNSVKEIGSSAFEDCKLW